MRLGRSLLLYVSRNLTKSQDLFSRQGVVAWAERWCNLTAACHDNEQRRVEVVAGTRHWRDGHQSLMATARGSPPALKPGGRPNLSGLEEAARSGGREEQNGAVPCRNPPFAVATGIGRKRKTPCVTRGYVRSLGISPTQSGQGRIRTADTGIFSPLLYQLSYLSASLRRALRDRLARPAIQPEAVRPSAGIPRRS